MNKVDFSTYKFRCSSLPELMTAARSKSEPLSETAKTKARELWIKEMYGREKLDLKTKYTEKGIACEPDSMDLVQKVTNQVYFKNNEKLENDFVTGTPDIRVSGEIIDIKSSFNLFTYADVDEETARKRYYWQMVGYMWLDNAKMSKLDFALVNTPEQIIQDEMYRASFQFPELSTSDEAQAEFRKNYIFDDIPEVDRLKVFPIEYNAEDVLQLQERLRLVREYMNDLSL